MLSERLWEFERASLIKVRNHTAATNVDESILIATVKNKQTGMEQNGTVCVEYVDRRPASLFCQSFGFVTGWWKIRSERNEYFE